MNRIAKGTPVYVFGSWNYEGTVYIASRIVGSMGAQQLHLLHTDGSPCGKYRRMYVAGLNTASETSTYVVPVSECTDPEAFALELARDQIARRIARRLEQIERYKAEYRKDEDAPYVRHAREDIAAQTPAVKRID